MHVRVLSSDIIAAGAKAFLIPTEDIMKDRRNRRIVAARHAIFKAFSMRGSSYGQIGRWMARDHTSVMHGVKRAEERMAQDKRYKEIVQSLAALGNERTN